MSITEKLKSISDYGFYILCFSLGMLVSATSWWVLPFAISLVVIVITVHTRLENLEFKNA